LSPKFKFYLNQIESNLFTKDIRLLGYYSSQIFQIPPLAVCHPEEFYQQVHELCT